LCHLGGCGCRGYNFFGLSRHLFGCRRDFPIFDDRREHIFERYLAGIGCVLDLLERS
jgi:hypothetical protein